MTPASHMIAVLPHGEPVGLGEVHRRLRECFGERVKSEPVACTGCRWALEVEVDGRLYALALETVPRERLQSLMSFTSEYDREACASATTCDFGVRITTHFGERPPWDLHHQLQLAHALFPELVALLDESAFTVRSRDWLEATTSTEVPPSPRAMYAIHSVVGEGERVWMHTHGLARCGCLEIELLDVPASSADSMVPLIDAVATQWMCDGAPACDDAFLAGHELEVAWLDHTRALGLLSKDGPGRADDRDEDHAGAVLVRRTRGWTGTKYSSPATYADRIDDNPMFFLPDLETHRQALLAAERLPQFVALQRRFSGEDDWRFLAKLGYVVDDGEPHQREHLWFEVIDVRSDAQVVATLLNAPYHVARLNEGDTGEHDLTLLTDWTIFSPHGRFTAQNVSILEGLCTETC